MGKKVERSISIERNPPGCMWGIVHALQQQPWHQVRKKMLPHRRRRGSESHGNDINVSDDGSSHEQGYSKMEKTLIEEQKGSSHGMKGSVKSRIKAFISDEMSKRRGKHRRSTSYPTRLQLTRTDSIHHLKDSDFHHSSESPNDGNSNIEKFLPSNSFKKQGNAVNMNRELLVKSLLQKTNSSRGKLKEKGYRKSLSFPGPDSSSKGRRRFGSMEDKSEFLWDNSAMDSNSGMKKDEEIKVPKKRFKNFKERIKHAMRESKKERRRITMDAIFHKVPCGQNFSHYEKDGFSDIKKEKGKLRCSSFKPPESSCFDESLDRYRQLYFSCFNQEANNHISERLKLRKEEEAPKRTMGRLFSLPDLRAYYLLQSGDSSGSGDKTPNKIDISKEMGKSGSSKFDELESGDVSGTEESEILFHELVKCGNEDREARAGDSKTVLENEVGSSSFVDFKVESLEGLGLDDFESLTTAHEIEDKNAEKPVTSNSIVFKDPRSISEVNTDSSTVAEHKPNIEKIETSIDQSNTELLHVPETPIDASKFNFVKYVLDLSGFSKHEALGAWHSPQQPLDPLMFEEFYEDDQPYENREKLLLFDLINEVLLEIYERSFTYCPIRLCLSSFTRPAPTGCHVIEEVWAKIRWHLDWRPASDQLLDEAMSRDLTKSDNWMNLHFEGECVGLELEDMIFDDMLDELISACELAKEDTIQSLINF